MKGSETLKTALKLFQESFVTTMRYTFGTPIDVSEYVEPYSGKSNPYHLVALLEFTGSVVGHLSIACEYGALAKFLSVSEDPSDDESRILCFDCFKEVLNSSAWDCIASLQQVYPTITMLTPKAVLGYYSFPKANISHALVKTSAGDFQLGVMIDTMQLDVNRLTEQLQISEKKLSQTVETLIQAKKEADEANRAKAEFISNISHEIRTPMNGVLGFTDLLMNTELDVRQTDYIETLKNSAEMLMALINDLLNFSIIDKGFVALNTQPVALDAMLQDIVNDTIKKLKNKELSIQMSYAKELPKQVCIDGGRLRQAIEQIIGNAVKFTIDGEVLLEATRMRIGKGDRIRLRVLDTGIGIPLDKKEYIFRQFTQVDGSISRQFGGSGVALFPLMISSPEGLFSHWKFRFGVPIRPGLKPKKMMNTNILF